MVTGDHRASGVHTGRERSARLGRLGPGTGILMGTLIGAGTLIGTAP